MKRRRVENFLFLFLSMFVVVVFISLISVCINFSGNYYLYYDDETEILDFLKNSKYNKRYEIMKSKISENAGDPSYFITIATYSVFMEKFDECRLFLEKAFDANPEKACYLFEIHNYFGSMLADIKKTDNAAEEYRIIRRAYPGSNGAFDLNAYVYDNVRDADLTEKAFMGEFFNHTCTDSIVSMGHLLLVQNDPDYALKLYKTGMYFDPGCSYLVTSSALANVVKKDYVEAREFAKTAAKMNPLWGMNYVILGNIDVLQGQYENGLDNYYRAVAIDPRRQENAYTGIGMAYLNLARENMDLLPPSWVLVLVFVFITIVIISINIKSYKKYVSQNPVDGAKRFRIANFTLLFIAILLNAFTVYFIADKNSPVYRATHQKTVYSMKSENALKKAVRLDPLRSDIYQDLSGVLKFNGKYAEASMIDNLAKKLPPPDIRQKLYIIY
jgi:tetratricopeptide (TPR) repeat protein